MLTLPGQPRLSRPLERAGFSSRFFDRGGVRLHYVVGPPREVPLVLVPGQSMTWESYHRVMPALSKQFEVYSVDVRGHGASSRTPGAYTFDALGGDLEALVRDVVKRPAVISGNSSGGLIALWLAAHAPDLVRAVVPEDAPLFSAEWPRLRDACWVYKVFNDLADTLGAPGGRDLPAFIARLQIPAQGSTRIMNFPRPLARVLGWYIRRREKNFPGEPVDLPLLPAAVRIWIKSLSTFDPDFARAFIDGSAARSLDHAETLRRVRCPMLLMQANSFIHPTLGLVGAMTDDDVQRAIALVPGSRAVKVLKGHTIHLEAPREFLREFRSFTDGLKLALP